jgi:putative DNA primase/helicase
LQDITSPVSAFVRDRCDIESEYEITTGELWDAWKVWCEDNGRRPGTKALFGRDLFAAYPMIRKRRPRDDEARVYTYEGIKLT